jgi:DNA-binding NarL/FixJ family response regulator
MMPKPAKVIIADDHAIVREGLIANVAKQPHLHIVGTATNFQEVTQLVRSVPADVLILDVLGMGGSPLTVVERFTRELPDLAIIVFSSSVDLVPELLQAGARGYVVKEELSEQLIGAIETVHAGQIFVSPIAQNYLARYTAQSARHRLTPQEGSVLKLLAQGLGTSEIADQLGIDPRTVHNYIQKLRNKTGCDERTQLVTWYQRIYGESVT